MSCKELERLNGKAFPISDGEQGRVVLSWNGGLLGTDLRRGGDVFIWFDESTSNSSTSPTKDANAAKPTGGEQVLRVNQVVWLFPAH
jgi:hypothetical protein